MRSATASRTAGSLVAVACALAVLPAAAGAQRPGTVVEKRVASAAPDARLVRESYVRVYDPLPASAGPHPAACDWIGYLRFRHPRGSRSSSRADAVVATIPGFLAGASSFDQLARNTIRTAAARRDAYIEVWALDRRANCLEDHTGVRAAARARDVSTAYGYYWGGRPANGRRFGGFKSSSEAAFLREFGLERTVRDWYTLLRRGIPDQRVRARKVICGGHSLGGPLTAAFAGWDFDGNPRTTADAGYNQCAGLMGLDTTLSIDGSDGGVGSAGSLGAFAGSSSPFVNAPPLTPETIQVISVFGVGAFHLPRATDLLRELPHSTNIDLSQRLLFSRDAANFATGIPSIRDFTTTNELTLAGVFDDNSAPLSFLRASLGFAVGGPIAEKDFPTPSDGTFAIPSEPDTPLYSWLGYDRIGQRPLALNDAGGPFTSRESEATSVRQFARSLFEAPLNFVEQYFPTRILVDVVAAEEGDRGGSLSGLRYDGPSKRPALLIQAGDSDSNLGADSGPPSVGRGPNSFARSREVTIPGYNHIDVTTAARRQNDGRPEPSSTALTDFLLDVIPVKPRIRLTVRPRRVRAGRRVRLRFRVRSSVRSCRRGVRIRFAGRRVRTRRSGRASLRFRRLGRTGRRRVIARKRGCRTGTARVRVLRKRRARRR